MHSPVTPSVFTIARTWGRLKCPPTDEPIKKYGIHPWMNSTSYEKHEIGLGDGSVVKVLALQG